MMHLNKTKCGICGNSISAAGSLKTHIKTVHQGIKTHKCELCDKSFGIPGNLKKHINNVHEGLGGFLMGQEWRTLFPARVEVKISPTRGAASSGGNFYLHECRKMSPPRVPH